MVGILLHAASRNPPWNDQRVSSDVVIKDSTFLCAAAKSLRLSYKNASV